MSLNSCTCLEQYSFLTILRKEFQKQYDTVQQISVVFPTILPTLLKIACFPHHPIQCVTDASTPSTPLTLALISCHFSNSCLGCTFSCEETFECLTESYICWQIFLLVNVYFIFLKKFPLIKNFKVRKMKKTLKKSEVN